MSEYNHTVKTTCKFCRKEFQSFAFKKVCPDCDNDMEKNFQLIKAYLIEFPDATVAEVCSDLEIPTALVKYFLKEDRLEITRNSGNHFLTCNSCGKPITRGRYCFECEILAMRSDMKATLVKNADEIKMEGEISRFHTHRDKRTRNAK